MIETTDLTTQERAALCLIASGADQRGAALLAGISDRTLRRRLADAQLALGAAGVIHAVAIAVDRGLIRPVQITPAVAAAVRHASAPACGTLAGYARHVQRGRRPCDTCRVVWDVRLADMLAGQVVGAGSAA